MKRAGYITLKENYVYSFSKFLDEERAIYSKFSVNTSAITHSSSKQQYL